MIQIPAIILAAGLSTRMGAFKPLLPLAGRPLLLHVVDSLRGSGGVDRIIIVTGHEAARVAEFIGAIHLDVTLVHNPDFADGEMLSSVRTGLALVRHAPAFLLAFADQPAVRPETITRLITAFSTHDAPLALPTYNETRGHPIILSSVLANEIDALAPTDTLKTVTRRHLARALLVPVDDPAILEDLDTPEDLARVQDRMRATVRPATPPAGDVTAL